MTRLTPTGPGTRRFRGRVKRSETLQWQSVSDYPGGAAARVPQLAGLSGWFKPPLPVSN